MIQINTESFFARILRKVKDGTLILSTHPIVRLGFSTILLLVWFVSDAGKIAFIAVVAFLMLFTVPMNPISNPKPFLLALLIFLLFEVSAHFALDTTSISIPFILLGIKILCLATSSVIAFSGLRFQGLLYLTSSVFPRFSVLVPTIISGWERVYFAYEQIRLRQRANGIGLMSHPMKFIKTLAFRSIWYLLLLAEELEIQVGVKWYGAPTYKTRLDLTFHMGDWIFSVFGLVILLVLFFF